MSFAYDVQAAVWNKHIRPHVKNDRLAMFFEMLMDDMHDANHKVPSANGVFKGDGVNKDAGVTFSAQRLDRYVRGLESGDVEP